MERSFPRSIQSLQQIFSFIDECTTAYALPPDLMPSVDLAVEELFTNMVKYQHPGSAEIRIECERVEEALQIRMTDHNVDRFDPTSLPDPDLTLPIEQRRPGGLGIFLTKRVMDDLHYEYRERTSIITVTKSFRRTDD
jgi:serine/threonine-protein kinase RsbW